MMMAPDTHFVSLGYLQALELCSVMWTDPVTMEHFMGLTTLLTTPFTIVAGLRAALGDKAVASRTAPVVVRAQCVPRTLAGACSCCRVFD